MVYVHTFPTLIYFLPKSTALSEREIKFRPLPFLKKSEIWHAAAGSRAKTARPPRECNARAKFLFCLLNLLFLDVLIVVPVLDLKVPNVSLETRGKNVI